VKLAQDGKETLLKVRKERFDLVLTDLKMPRMDGIQLLKELQKIIPKECPGNNLLTYHLLTYAKNLTILDFVL